MCPCLTQGCSKLSSGALSALALSWVFYARAGAQFSGNLILFFFCCFLINVWVCEHRFPCLFVLTPPASLFFCSLKCQIRVIALSAELAVFCARRGTVQWEPNIIFFCCFLINVWVCEHCFPFLFVLTPPASLFFCSLNGRNRVISLSAELGVFCARRCSGR